MIDYMRNEHVRGIVSEATSANIITNKRRTLFGSVKRSEEYQIMRRMADAQITVKRHN